MEGKVQSWYGKFRKLSGFQNPSILLLHYSQHSASIYVHNDSSSFYQVYVPDSRKEEGRRKRHLPLRTLPRNFLAKT